MRRMRSQKALGVVLSYASIGLNTLANFLLTPRLLSCLGTDGYALYQLLYSLFISLTIADIGIQTLTIRYIAFCRVRREATEQENILFHFAALVTVICLVVFFAGWGVLANIQNIYPKHIGPGNVALAREIVGWMMGTLLCTFAVRFLDGVTVAYERFGVSNMIKILQILIRFSLLFFLIPVFPTGALLAFGDFAAAAVMFLLCAAYVFTRLKVRVRFHRWDKKLLREVAAFGSTIILGNILSVINGRVDIILLGILGNAAMVANYNISTQIFTAFVQIGDSISTVFMPEASGMIARNAPARELEDFIIRPGRVQFYLCATVIVGFWILGRPFIAYWLGQPNEAVWLTCMVLLPANLLMILQGVCNKLMLAKLANRVCTVILFGINLVNVLLTIHLIRKVGYLGAPIGTAVALVLGWGGFMPLYFKAVLKIHIGRVARGILSGTAWPVAASGVAAFLLSQALPQTLWAFLGVGLFFLGLNLFLFFRWGMAAEEKLWALSALGALHSRGSKKHTSKEEKH